MCMPRGNSYLWSLSGIFKYVVQYDLFKYVVQYDIRYVRLPTMKPNSSLNLRCIKSLDVGLFRTRVDK